MATPHTPQTQDLRSHWDDVYTQNPLDTVSWYQPVPQPSLDLVQTYAPEQAPPLRLIDVGGGDSYLTDNLLEAGGYLPTVLDISAASLDRHRERLGTLAKEVAYVVANVLEFSPEDAFDIWHDRAVFHFLTTDEQMQHYAKVARKGIRTGGTLIIGTFAKDGPERCSGLNIRQHDVDSLDAVFDAGFERLHTQTHTHSTPSGGDQAFIFAVYRRV